MPPSEDLFQRKNNTTPFLVEFPPFKTFSIGTDSIQTVLYYSRLDAAFNNNHFNCPQPRDSSGKRSFQRYSKSIVLSLCIAKISLPAQFHSISIFLYYSTPAGLTSERGLRYLCYPSGCGRIVPYTAPADMAPKPNPPTPA